MSLSNYCREFDNVLSSEPCSEDPEGESPEGDQEKEKAKEGQAQASPDPLACLDPEMVQKIECEILDAQSPKMKLTDVVGLGLAKEVIRVRQIFELRDVLIERGHHLAYS